MVKVNIFAGGTAAFIITYSFNSDDGTLTNVQNLLLGAWASPYWIEKSVVEPYVLYAVDQETLGGIQVFGMENGGLTSNFSYYNMSHGSDPSHIFALSTGEISVVNSGTQNRNVAIFPIAGSNIEATVIGIDGDLSDPVQTVLYKDDELLVTDPGSSVIWRLVRNESTRIFSNKGKIIQPSGATARRAATFNDTLVTLQAKTNTIFSQSIPPLNQSDFNNLNSLLSSIGSNISSYSDFSGEVLIPSPNQFFPTTLVYASLYNDEDGDSIAVVSLQSDGTLTLVNQYYTGLKKIRGMRIGGPDDKYLVAGGSSGGGIIVWERVEKGNSLTQIASDKDAASHTSFVWANMDN